MIEWWWLFMPIPIWAIVGAGYATYKWKGFTADMIRFQVNASRVRPDSYTEQMAMQRLKALALTIDDDPEFLRRAGFEDA